MVTKSKFKEVFNEIGKKYEDTGIENLYQDYNLLCLLVHISEEFIDDDVKDEVVNLLEDLKSKMENQEVEWKK